MKYICNEILPELTHNINMHSAFFQMNNLLLSPHIFTNTQSFENELQNALNITKYIFDSITNNIEYQKKISFTSSEVKILNWNSIAIHCLMTAYDTLFQQNNHTCYSFELGRCHFEDAVFSRNSPLGNSLKALFPWISTKRLCSLRNQLQHIDMGDFFFFSTLSSKKRKKPLLYHEIPLLTSLISGILLPFCSDESSILDHSSSHKLQKKLEIYFQERKTKHILSNYDLLLTMPASPTDRYFFPGYYPIEELVYIDMHSKNLNAFDYYINYKLESIFNIETAYMIRDFFLNPKYRDYIFEPNSDASMKDFCNIAKCQALLLRKYVIQNTIDFFLPPTLSKKRFQLYNKIYNGAFIDSRNLQNFSHADKIWNRDYNECLIHFKDICDNLSNFLIPLCEWIFFTQLVSQKTPSWKTMQDGFLSLFRKYFCKEFKPFVDRKSVV